MKKKERSPFFKENFFIDFAKEILNVSVEFHFYDFFLNKISELAMSRWVLLKCEYSIHIKPGLSIALAL